MHEGKCDETEKIGTEKMVPHKQEMKEGKTMPTDIEEKEPNVFVRPRFKEKGVILERLLEYRRKHGLGCFSKLSALCNGEVSAGELRDMLFGEEIFSLDKWLLVKAALDLEEEEHENAKL